MHHGRRLVSLEHRVDRRALGDVAFDENVGRIAPHRLERIEVAGVSQLIEVDDPRRLLGNALPHETTADESGAAGDKYRLHDGHVPAEEDKLGPKEGRRRKSDGRGADPPLIRRRTVKVSI